MRQKLAPYFPGMIFFCLALVISLLTYKDYGVSWDEAIQRDLGLVSYNYAFNNDTALLTHHDKALGTGFEMPLIIAEKCLNITDSRDVYLMRHLTIHLFFLICVFGGYILAFRLFKSRVIASLAFILLAFHPRIYAHSFFNSKDLPFLSVTILVLLMAQLAFEKNKVIWYSLLGLACGYATSIRSMGVIFIPCIGLFLLADLLRGFADKSVAKAAALNMLMCAAGFCVALYVAWPYLWHDPIHRFVGSFQSLANIFSGGTVLFNGRVFPSEKLPLDYMPIWFSITMPELWLVCGLTGLLVVVASFAWYPKQFLFVPEKKVLLLCVMCFSGPVIAMVAFHGVNIDDWRHLYFIYPSFVVLILFIVSKLLAGRFRMLMYVSALLQLTWTGWFMVRAHPFQQVYFNELVSHEKEYLRMHYDLEYWGCSYKEGLDFLVSHYKNDTLRIRWDMDPLRNNVLLLRKEDRDRIKLVEDNPDYMITTYRGHPDFGAGKQALYSIKVLNSTIMSVYSMH